MTNDDKGDEEMSDESTRAWVDSGSGPGYPVDVAALGDPVSGATYAFAARAWHDVVCPEGPGCRSRELHALHYDATLGAVLDRFLHRHAELVIWDETDRDDGIPEPGVPAREEASER